MKTLFIDTNVLLGFYHFSGDDLEELRKLAVLATRGELRLLMPDQVLAEFRRNRGAKIADAVKRLSTQTFVLQAPQLSKDYEEYKKLQSLLGDYSQLHSDLTNKIRGDIRTGNLKADSVLQELFGQSKTIETSPELVEKARLRMDLGNPPGKKGSLGDAVIWEALLQEVPTYQRLFFVSDDADYYSVLEDGELDEFLVQEWRAKKQSAVVPYKRISQFLQANYPGIVVATEVEKDALIRELETSGSFLRTHDVIGRLSKFSEFTSVQLNAIAQAATANNQVNWIIPDSDVREFLVSIIKGREIEVDPDYLQLLNKHLGEEVFEETPF